MAGTNGRLGRRSLRGFNMDFRSQRTWWFEAVGIARRHARRTASDAAADLAQDLAVAALERGARTRQAGPWLERVARNSSNQQSSLKAGQRKRPWRLSRRS